jgi:hypothetical protein
VREGLVERAELVQGYTCLVKVNNGCVITRTINTTAEEVQLFDILIKLEETQDTNTSENPIIGGMEPGKTG